VIYLLRHGDAEEGGSDDAARRLTSKGERQAGDAGRALAALGVELAACLTSPKVRAAETARLACEGLDVEPEMADELRGGGFEPASITAGCGEVLLVGHEPDLSNAIAALTGARARLRKGGLAAIEDRELQWLLTPKQLRMLARVAD